VVALPSRRFPLLVASLAEQVALVGQLPLVDALAVSGPPPTADAASAVRARDLLTHTCVRYGASFDGAALLVDDTDAAYGHGCVGLLVEAGAS
jgi:ATP-dependent DNA helicase RecQ